ncbi:hypothetical protein Syun_025106 [Stephania yunnanensis]|uniref:Aspartate/glutamate/uridylate kinase domain-containing protein n=1 Tax=Stephania yunnanensis TaxID=152371 RepID=A0AAP0ER21_9MAGN
MLGSRPPLLYSAPPNNQNEEKSPNPSRPKSPTKPLNPIVSFDRLVPPPQKSLNLVRSSHPKSPNRSRSLLSTLVSPSRRAGLSGLAGLAVSLVSPSRRAGLRHRLSTFSLYGLSVSCSVTALHSLIADLKLHFSVSICSEWEAILEEVLGFLKSPIVFHFFLAALLALELKADLFILLSDVEGLYSGPPSDPQSKLIDTYKKEKHQGEITFGGKSRVGRGGMIAKVKVAINALMQHPRCYYKEYMHESQTESETDFLHSVSESVSDSVSD